MKFVKKLYFKPNWKIFFLFFVVSVFIFSGSVQAIDLESKKLLNQNILYYDLETGCTNAAGVTSEANCTCTTGASTTLSGANNEAKVWEYLKGKGLTPPQIAGIMGNMQAEAHFEPKLVEYGWKNSRGETSVAGTPSSLDDNMPPNQGPQGQPGYGIVQWTSPGRKQGLKTLATTRKIITGDLALQLDYLWQELNTSYKSSVYNPILATQDYKVVTDIFLTRYEVPGDIPGTRPIRERNAFTILGKYGSGTTSTGATPVTATPATTCGATAGPIDTAGCPVTAPVWGRQNGVGEQYDQAELTRIFGDPGTASSRPAIDAKLIKVDFLGHSVNIHQLAAGCLTAVANEIKSKNITYTIKEMGCYRFDSNNGSTNIGLRSYHTYGVACDINWSTNPFVSGGSSAPYDMPAEYVTAFRNHGFTWGGNWTSVKDYMHFEFNGIKP